jgi:hypothetical protein
MKDHEQEQIDPENHNRYIQHGSQHGSSQDHVITTHVQHIQYCTVHINMDWA